jgi:predicted O-methyltransferase YrrM
MAQRRDGSMTPAGIGEYKTLAKGEEQKRILETIEYVRGQDRTWASVPAADGRMLRILTEAANAQHVVEIGTSTGYSGLWICLALSATGGRLTTFEYDAGRAKMARGHFEKAGVTGMVEIVEGDAHATVKQLKGPIDVVFIDADKEGYLDYLNQLLPLVRPGGLILAHNIEMSGTASYNRAVTTNPDLETTYYLQGNGLSISLKKH